MSCISPIVVHAFFWTFHRLLYLDSCWSLKGLVCFSTYFWPDAIIGSRSCIAYYLFFGFLVSQRTELTILKLKEEFAQHFCTGGEACFTTWLLVWRGAQFRRLVSWRGRYSDVNKSFIRLSSCVINTKYLWDDEHVCVSRIRYWSWFVAINFKTPGTINTWVEFILRLNLALAYFAYLGQWIGSTYCVGLSNFLAFFTWGVVTLHVGGRLRIIF